MSRECHPIRVEVRLARKSYANGARKERAPQDVTSGPICRGFSDLQEPLKVFQARKIPEELSQLNPFFSNS
jgi:hypothetical protein